jgi:hypothetical protein
LKYARRIEKSQQYKQQKKETNESISDVLFVAYGAHSSFANS